VVRVVICRSDVKIAGGVAVRISLLNLAAVGAAFWLLLGTANAAAASQPSQKADGSHLSSQARVTSIGVVAVEFRFRLSKKSAHRGTVVFHVVNHGKLPHDFKIAGRKTPIIKPGKSAVLRVVFRKAGHYRYLCTVPGHAAAGMKGVLKVA
jgi:uncharacterized cupredoxin-like copper-binding protein